ncbi:MAG: AI-2E family transporter [Deltaproteobacteria bacterium]|nr:AI-2E family transporter [Deltaproteobacteria bacterium]
MGMRQKALQRRTHRYWHVAFIAAVLTSAFFLLQGLGRVLTPVVAALLLTYLLDPPVSWMASRLALPRWLGTLVLLLVTVALLVLVLVLIIPVIAHELEVFAARLEQLPQTLLPWIERTFGVQLPHSFKDLWAHLGGDVRHVSGDVLGSLGGVAGKVAKGTMGIFSAVGGLAAGIGTAALIPVFTLYFLPQFPNIVGGIRNLIPFRYREWVEQTVTDIDRTLASWMRGQLTVMACLATLYALGLKFIVDLEMAVVIGLLTGLLAFIPYVGFILGMLSAFLVLLLGEGGLDTTQLFKMLAVFGGVQLLDGMVLTPRIVGEKAGIGPVGVLAALLVGGKLFGFIGVLLAVPTAAALAVVVKGGIEAYKTSLLYRRGEDEYIRAHVDESKEA